MKLTHINGALTKSEREVAFNTSEPVDDAVLSAMKTDQYDARHVDGAIVLKAWHEAVSIAQRQADQFATDYQAAKAKLANDAENAKAMHEHMLAQISKRTGLPVA